MHVSNGAVLRWGAWVRAGGWGVGGLPSAASSPSQISRSSSDSFCSAADAERLVDYDFVFWSAGDRAFVAAEMARLGGRDGWKAGGGGADAMRRAPTHEGWKACRRLKQNRSCPSIRIDSM